jgi:hypothetical protein
MRQAASLLRPVLEPRTDPAALGAYPTLWAFQFATLPPSAYETFRKQVAADVARLRALNLENVRQWWTALQEGYKLTNDEKQSDWAVDQSARRFPSDRSLPARNRWYESRTFPGLDAPADQKTAYYRDLLKQTDAWIQQRPNSYTMWFDRLQALESLDDSPAAEVESCVTKLLALAHAAKGPEPLDFITDFQLVAAIYNRKLPPQRQLELARNGLAQSAAESARPPDDRYISPKMSGTVTFQLTSLKFSLHFYEADAYVRLKQAGKAQAALTQAEAALEALAAQLDDKEEFRKTYASQQTSFWLAQAGLARLRGHKLDAMGYYQSALLARLDSGSQPAPGEKDDLAHDAHALWISLGGSEASWKLWYTRRAQALSARTNVIWENVRTPLPPFQLTDLQGKTWQLADLKGKVAFLNFWASY